MGVTALVLVLTSPTEHIVRRSLHQTVPTQAQVCASYLGARVPSTGLSLILTADPGTFSGTAEAHFILDNLEDQVVKPAGESVCAGVVLGRLMGQHVLVVTTGIGPTAAGLCVQELLTNCGSVANDMIYFGTSGWSPQLGGVLNPPDCAQANPSRKITRLGDVCISPVSVNWSCKKSTWSLQAEGYSNQCFRPPEIKGPNATDLYGECIFATDNLDGNLALADSLIAVARSGRGRRAMPLRADAVVEVESRYWGLMANGTGVPYPEIGPDERPFVWDYRQCAEVDAQFFFTGAPWEIKARDYAAEAISMAVAHADPDSDDRDAVRADEVIAVSAMEGVGVAEALEKYHRLDSTPRRIPYTNVRTASNYNMQPVGKAGDGRWDIPQEVPEDYVNGYAYAIATGSATIMSLFRQRCLAAQELDTMGASDPAQKQLLAQQLQQQGLGGLALWARAGGRGVGDVGAEEGAEGGAAAADGPAVGQAVGRKGGVSERGDAKRTRCRFTINYA